MQLVMPVAFALAASILSLPAAEIAARTGDPGDANAITGSARVIDGDTLSIGQVRIRLEGIDAPEVGQTCKGRGGVCWPCGSAAATAALEKLIAGKPVRCDRRGSDKYGRTLAVCFVRGRDINADMVRQGYAWAFVKYSSSYVKEEAAARAGQRGIWQAPTAPAWDYRQRHWDTRRNAGPGRLRHQGQHHQERPHLPHALEPLVRPDQHGAGQGQALVLQRGRSRRRRLAAGAGPLRAGA